MNSLISSRSYEDFYVYDLCNTCQISSPDIECAEPDPALRLELQNIIETIAAPGKGLLACDESPENLGERFQELGIENTESTRRDYREMLLSADKVAARDCGRNFELRRRERIKTHTIDLECDFDLTLRRPRNN